MERNKIEIEFIDEDSKHQFKQLVGDKSGPFFEKLFPWPPLKLHGKELQGIDSFLWADQTQGILPNFKPSEILARSERPNTLIYAIATTHWPSSYRFIKNFAFMFPVRRVKLTHYTATSNICIRERAPHGSYILNCSHADCQNYVLPRVYELDWRRLPHPIYEVHQTINGIIKGRAEKSNFTEEEYGRIYHHVIFENTFFAIYENPVIKNARSVFEEQVSHINNPYLFSLVYLDGYAPEPNIKATINLMNHAKYVDGLYTQPRNKGHNTRPTRVQK